MIHRHTAGLLVLTVMAPALCAAQTPMGLDREVNRTYRQESLSYLLRDLGKRGNVKLWILPGTSNLPQKLSLSLQKVTVRQALDKLAKALNLEWTESGRLVVLKPKAAKDALAADTKKYQGKTLVEWRAQLLIGTGRYSYRGRSQSTAARALAKVPAAFPTLVAALGDSNYTIRRAAQEGLRSAGAKGAQAMVERLRQPMERTESYNLESAIRGMGQLAGPALVSEVKSSPNAQARATALRILMRMSPLPKGAVAAIIAALKSPNVDAAFRKTILSQLNYARGGDLIPVWLYLLEDTDSSTRRQALYGLRSMASTSNYYRRRYPKRYQGLKKHGPALVKAVTKILQNDAESRLRSQAAETLGYLGSLGPDVAKVLGAQLLAEPMERVRYSICKALGRLGAAAVPHLLKGLRADPRLRSTIGYSLSRLGKDAVPALIAAAKDPSPVVRAAVATALGRAGSRSKESLPQLAKLLKDSDATVRKSALEAIYRMGAPGRPLLLKALESDDAAIRMEAMRTVARDPRLAEQAVTVLIQGLGDADHRVRAAAAGALGSAGAKAKAATAALVELFKDPQPQVRAAAAGAFARIKTDPAAVVPALCNLLEDTDYSVRRNASMALVAYKKEAKRGLKPLMGILKDSTQAEARAAALKVLAGIGPEAKEAHALIVAASQDPDRSVRREACVALAAVAPSSDKTAARLFDLVEDEAADVRAAAARGLIRLPKIPKQHVATLVASASNMLRDGYSSRRVAAQLLAKLAKQDPNAIRALVDALDDRRLGYSSDLSRAIQKIGSPAVPFLLDAMKRNRASRALSVLSGMKLDKKSVPLLVELLNSPDRNRRRLAAQALSNMGQDAAAAVKSLGKALTDTDYSVRSAALRALGKIGAPAAEELAKALSDPRNRSRRYDLIRALERIGAGAKGAVPHLIKILLGKDRYTAERCARVLGKIGKPAVDPLIAALKGDPALDVQTRIVMALGEIGKPAAKAAPLMVKLLDDRRSRYTVVRALGKLGKGAVPSLVKALKHVDDQVRRGAVDALSSMGKEARGAVPALIEALDDRRLRYYIRSALRRIGVGKAGMAKIREALKSDDPEVRSAAISALAGAGPEALPLLKEALQSPDQQIKAAALNALGKVGKEGKILVPELIACLPDRRLGYQARVALGKIGAGAVPALIKALGHEADLARQYAAEALRDMGKAAQPAIPALQELLKSDPAAQVRLAAATALARAGADTKAMIPMLLKEWNRASDEKTQRQYATAIGELGPKAVGQFLPYLIKDLAHDMGIIRKRALISMAVVAANVGDDDAKKVVPTLIKVAEKDFDANLRIEGVKALGAFKARAESALPMLRKLQQKQSRSYSPMGRALRSAVYSIEYGVRQKKYKKYRKSRRVIYAHGHRLHRCSSSCRFYRRK